IKLSKEFDIALKLTKLALHSKIVKLIFASSFSFQSSSAALGDFINLSRFDCFRQQLFHKLFF
ncbi:hypothetical protein, partial [Exiguobacterium sp. KJ 601]|uniref:hypothetical protein n=1 Tax=Exiguobacterium sp. KJ 601 TaxID=2782569 RepID=UPI0022AEBE86